jgi:[acyl-carrier-protein] S-malonyltransferase
VTLGVIFPGQGSQLPGMGQDLYHAEPQARRLYRAADQILGYDLLRACENRNGELSDTAVVQPAIVAHSLICWTVLAGRLPAPPAAAAGHSLGEISALAAAGALGFEAAVRLAARRGRLMADCPPGRMAAVIGLPAEQVARLLLAAAGGRVTVANRNSADQCVISGEPGALAEAEAALVAAGGSVKTLRVSVAAHSPLMRPAEAGFAEAIGQAGLTAAAVPVASSCGAGLVREPSALAGSLLRQLTGCVDWPATVELMTGLGVDALVEVGPKNSLRDLTRSQFPGLRVESCGTVPELRAAAAPPAGPPSGARIGARSGAGPSAGLEAFLLAALRLAVGTPDSAALPADGYAAEVRAPYQRLAGLLDELRAGLVPDPAAALAAAAGLTGTLLRGKGLSDTQSHEAITRAMTGTGTES